LKLIGSEDKGIVAVSCNCGQLIAHDINIGQVQCPVCKHTDSLRVLVRGLQRNPPPEYVPPEKHEIPQYKGPSEVPKLQAEVTEWRTKHANLLGLYKEVEKELKDTKAQLAQSHGHDLAQFQGEDN